MKRVYSTFYDWVLTTGKYLKPTNKILARAKQTHKWTQVENFSLLVLSFPAKSDYVNVFSLFSRVT